MSTIADIIRIMDDIAPQRLAEAWDNVGLHYGDPGWPVSTVFVSLDPTLKAVESAAAAGANLLITHHPLIFKPVSRLNVKTPVGAVIDLAARKQIAVFCAHTNLDSVTGGINDVLAEKIGMSVTGPLSSIPEEQQYKLVVFTPPANADRMMNALFANASVKSFGNDNHCAFYNEGTGQFVSDRNGEAGTDRMTRNGEIRIEFSVGRNELDAVVNIMKNSDEGMATYDIYPLFQARSGNGLGRIGEFARTRTLLELAGDIKQSLSLKMVKYAGPEDLQIRTAAVCSGGGSGMTGDFLTSKAQVFISGDLNHHAAIDIAASGRGLIDIGHFSSEQIIVSTLCSRIRAEAEKLKMPVSVIPWTGEPDPFSYI